MGTESTVIRKFPAQSVAVKNHSMNENTFQTALASMISRLDVEVIQEMIPSAKKAGKDVAEIRDTTNPDLVTKLLMAILEAVGRQVPTVQISKKTRDDVLWHNALQPWRRSPLWLMIRVVIQTTLAKCLSTVQAQENYKNFCIHVLSDIATRTMTMTTVDTLHFLNTKIARRVHKLGSHAYGFIQLQALQVVQRGADKLEEGWVNIQREDADRSTGVDSHSLEADTSLSLTSAKPYLDLVLGNKPTNKSHSMASDPRCTPWLAKDSDGLPMATTFDGTQNGLILSLIAFEDWTAHCLPGWVEQIRTNALPSHCTALGSIMLAYKEKAVPTYCIAPEQSSIMLLTLGELWKALDMIVTDMVPLLKDFSPEIPKNFFDPLLLPKKEQMEQLFVLENYIHSRHSNAKNVPSIFSTPRSSSFTTAFFNRSPEHQSLRAIIKAQAEEYKAEKRKEWTEKTARYGALRSAWQNKDCNTVRSKRGNQHHEASRCAKCDLKSQMEKIVISVYEWPLPDDKSQCATCVFELACPTPFSVWRELTWTFIHDLGRQTSLRPEAPKAFLCSYPGLVPHFSSRASSIVLASGVKAFGQAHYGTLKFPTTFERCILPHAPRYHVFDRNNNIWTAQQQEIPELGRYCVHTLPDGPYAHLQYTINSTGYSQNRVIADQGSCPAGISLHEHVAYGSVRADGELTQWTNILQELRASNLNFSAEPVALLNLQTAWQAGSRSASPLRKSHENFLRGAFCHELLAAVDKRLDSIEANWKSDHALWTMIVITLRCLSLTLDDGAAIECMRILRRVRQTAQTWVLDLLRQLESATDKGQIQKLDLRLLRTALLAKMTFDVPPSWEARALESIDDTTCWLYCSIVARNHMPPSTLSLPTDILRLSIRSLRLSLALHQRICKVVLTSYSLHSALSQIWSSFGADFYTIPWLGSPDWRNRWAKLVIPATPHMLSQVVLYNVIEGDLLVNGTALGRLPDAYTRNEMYSDLFGSQILPAFVADMPGMSHEVAKSVAGHRIYFGSQNDRLRVCTKNGTQTFEYIPRTCFSGDVPLQLVDNYHHWLDIDKKEIEFRPRNNPWKLCEKNPRIFFGLRSYMMVKPSRTLIDPRSNTFKSISGVLGCLELDQYIHALITDQGVLEIELPRLDLHFCLNQKGALECQELRKIVAPDQTLGTLVGLRSRLLLCGADKLSAEHDQVLLIPEGEVDIARKGDHISASISCPGSRIRILRYQVDKTLGRLQGDGTPTSGLFMAYLHAITAHCLADPLTGHSGTDEALAYLRKRSSKLLEPPNQRIGTILDKISRLTPQRWYYPTHLQDMQTVTWNKDLPVSSQHDDFTILAQEIINSGNQYAVLYPGTNELMLRKIGNETLLHRARRRNRAYQGSGICTDFSRPVLGSEYTGRDDQGTENARCRNAFYIASLIVQWPTKFEVCLDFQGEMKTLDRISGFSSQTECCGSLSQLLDLHLPHTWGYLYGMCISSDKRRDQHQLLFDFSILAYSMKFPSPSPLLSLLAFAFLSELKSLRAPIMSGTYVLSSGWAVQSGKVMNILRNRATAWVETDPSLSDDERQQRLADHNDEVERQAKAVTQHLSSQWPCEKPNMPAAASAPLLQLQSANSQISSQFKIWHRNLELIEYISDVQQIFNTAFKHSTIRRKALGAIDLKILHLESAQLPALRDLLLSITPKLSCAPEKLSMLPRSSNFLEDVELASMIGRLGTSMDDNDRHPTRRLYAHDLKASYDELMKSSEAAPFLEVPLPLDDIVSHHSSWQNHIWGIMQDVKDRIKPTAVTEQILHAAGLWPKATWLSLLASLSSTYQHPINPIWRNALFPLGVAVTSLQRARRMLLAAEKADSAALVDELVNVGHVEWSPKENPDWLLVELENDFLIRPIQARVASEMILPSSSSNSLTQLNMGEGKSSVIVPLVACSIGNGHQLARIIALKSLHKQMVTTLARRLGGLVDRQLYAMPFTRKTQIDTGTMQRVQGLLQECRDTHGILIAQPEHMLSFKLMGRERLLSMDYDLASRFLKTQKWLDCHARDLMDESDEILDVKFQLQYTLGTQRMMQGQPDRWLLTLSVFDLINKHCQSLLTSYPGQVEVEYRNASSFPTIRLLSSNVGDALMLQVALDVCRSSLPLLNLTMLPENVVSAVLRFIQDPNVDGQELELVKDLFRSRSSLVEKLLLLRGLLAHNILLFVLGSKRWSVNYGLHPSRCLSAVPYRAKGVPAMSAEFGHPDVMIALTCLAYYYSGLSSPQLRQCFEILQKAEDPTHEYSKWAYNSSTLPQSLHSWTAINLEDEGQFVNQLYPCFRCNKKTMDFFLANVVFPQEAKEFDEKLSASGCDIPLEPGQHLSTGFSGTNDNRFLLPSSIAQHDLPELKHTSAKVLHYVLGPENNAYYCARSQAEQQLASAELIRFIHETDPRIRVVIDVGAQVLDVTNIELVRIWLVLNQEVDAGIAFDADDNLMVITREGFPEPFATSSFQSRIDRCVVYLDEAHTRGVDLKLPRETRAAVTLGPRLAKDKLVQGKKYPSQHMVYSDNRQLV